MEIYEHRPEDSDGTQPMPDDYREWTQDDLIAEIEGLNEQVAKWVGVAAERRGAVEALREVTAAWDAMLTNPDLTLGPVEARWNEALAEAHRLGGQ